MVYIMHGLRFLFVVYKRSRLFLQLPIGLALSDIRRRFVGSKLGLIWFFLNPLFQTLLFTLFYTAFQGSFNPTYPLYVLTGFALWEVVVSSVLLGCGTFYYAEGYVKNFNFKTLQYVLRTPISIMLSYIVHSLLICIYCLFINEFSVIIAIITCLCLVPIVFYVSTSISLLFCYLGLASRDLINIMPHILQAIWFISPVFIWKDFFSDDFEFLLTYNPVYYLLNLLRIPIFEGTFPSIYDFTVTLALSSFFLLLGYIAHMKLNKNIGLRI